MTQSLRRWSSFTPTPRCSWEYFLVWNISKERGSPERRLPWSMFYSPCLSLGLPCLGSCSSGRQHVPVFSWYFGVTVFTSSSSLLFSSLSLQRCVCVRVFMCCACVCVGVSSLGRWKVGDHMLCSNRPQPTALLQSWAVRIAWWRFRLEDCLDLVS